MQEIVPLFIDYNIVFVANEECSYAKLQNNGYSIYSIVPIGSNCMINNFKAYEAVNKICESYTDDKPLLVLCSAASLSNIVVRKCFEKYPQHTFIDIGSSLNPVLDLDGWQYSRGYLKQYWLGEANRYGDQVDVW
jgi:hypothetical protein